MSIPEVIYNIQPFNEDQWIKTIFLISDTQSWLNEIQKGMIFQLPIQGRKKLLKKTFYLSISALAHIIERHYYKINRFPASGKFTIPITDILSYIRDSYDAPATKINGSLNFQRVITTDRIIGFDKNGIHINFMTIVTDSGGNIITAFPGTLE